MTKENMQNLLEQLAEVCMILRAEEGCMGCDEFNQEWLDKMDTLYAKRDRIIDNIQKHWGFKK